MAFSSKYSAALQHRHVVTERDALRAEVERLTKEVLKGAALLREGVVLVEGLEAKVERIRKALEQVRAHLYHHPVCAAVHDAGPCDCAARPAIDICGDALVRKEADDGK